MALPKGSRSGAYVPFGPRRTAASFAPSYTGSTRDRLSSYYTRPTLSDDPEAVETTDDKIAKSVVRLLASPDKKAKAKGLDYLKKNGNEIAPESLKRYNLDKVLKSPPKQSKEWYEKGIVGSGLGLLGTTADYLSRPGQAVLEGIDAGMYSVGLSGNDALKDDSRGHSWGDVVNAITGHNRVNPMTGKDIDGALDFSDALGVRRDNTGWKGWVNAGANFVGGAAADPLNLVGGGVGKGAEVGLETAGRLTAKEVAEQGAERLSPALAKQLGKSGATDFSETAIRDALKRTGIRRGLTGGQRDALRAGLIEQAPNKIQSTGTVQRLMGTPVRDVELQGDKGLNKILRQATGRDVRDAGTRLGEDQYRQLLDMDRGGLRFARRTVVPGAPLRDASRALRLTDKYRPVAGVSNELSDALVPARDRVARVITESTDPAEAKRFGEVYDQLDKQIAASGYKAPTSELQPGLLGELRRTRPVQRLRSGFITSQPILDSAEFRAAGNAPEIRQTVNALKSEAEALSSSETRGLLRKYQTAINNAKHMTRDDILAGTAALERGRVPQTVARWEAEGKHAEAQLLRASDEMRHNTFADLIDHGLADPNKLHDVETYLSHRASPAAARTGGLSAETSVAGFTPSDATAAGAQGGHLQARARPDLTIAQINAQDQRPAVGFFDRLAGKTEGAAEEDFRLLSPERAVQTNHAKANALWFDSMADPVEGVKGLDGNPLVQRIRPDVAPEVANARRAVYEKQGLRKVDLSGSGEAWVHKDLEPVVKEVSKGLTDDAAEGVLKVYDKWQNLWKGYATVPVISGSSFMARNGMGNVFANYLRGVSNPAWYAKAIKYQRAIAAAEREFPGEELGQALEKVGKLDSNEIAKAVAMKDHSVIDAGFAKTDLGHQDIHDLTVKGPKARRVNPFDRRNAFVHTGTVANQAVETNARIAHFLYALEDTGSVKDAAASVKKYLFDYGDLTHFENHAAKRVAAFYTYARKNTPLMLRQVFAEPAKFNRLSLAQRELLGFGQADSNAPTPEFMQPGQGMFGPSQAGLAGGSKNTPIIGSLDSPWATSLRQLDPVVKTAALIPGVKDVLPEGVADPAGAAGVAREWVNQANGGPISALKLLASEGAGKNIGTGGNRVDKDGKRKRPVALDLADLIIPAASKADRTYNLSSSSKEGARARTIRAITGLNLKQVTPELQDMARSSKNRELADIIKSVNDPIDAKVEKLLSSKNPPANINELVARLQAQGVPSLTALEAVGVVPEHTRHDALGTPILTRKQQVEARKRLLRAS